MHRFAAVVLPAAVVAGLAFAHAQKDQTYTELFHESSQAIGRDLASLHRAANDWLANRDMNVLVEALNRAYDSAHGIFGNAPYRYITIPVERGRFATVVRATGTLNPISTVDVSSELLGRIAEVRGLQ
jgi:hypothetical protein